MCIVLCQEENQVIFVLDIDNQNKTYVFASKDIHVTYFSIVVSIASNCLSYSNNASEE